VAEVEELVLPGLFIAGEGRDVVSDDLALQTSGDKLSPDPVQGLGRACASGLLCQVACDNKLLVQFGKKSGEGPPVRERDDIKVQVM
jgi:hypothetical protein